MQIEILRNLLIRYGAQIGLEPCEILCTWHLLDHDHNGKGYVFPSEETIAERMGRKRTSISRIVKKLESKNIIEIKRKQGISNRYSYRGIFKKLLPCYQQEIENAKRQAEQAEQDKSYLSENGQVNNIYPSENATPPVKKLTPPVNFCDTNSLSNSLSNSNEDLLNNIDNKKIQIYPSGEKVSSKGEKKKFGENQNVSMTDDEYEKLVQKFGEETAKACIEKLDVYKGANGKKYKNDYLAILNWVVDSVKKNGTSNGATNGKANSYAEGQRRAAERLQENRKKLEAWGLA